MGNRRPLTELQELQFCTKGIDERNGIQKYGISVNTSWPSHNSCQDLQVYKKLTEMLSRICNRHRIRLRGYGEGSTDESSEASTSKPKKSPEEVKQLAINNIILNVAHAHLSNCRYTKEHTHNLVGTPIRIPSFSPEPGREDLSLEERMEKESFWLLQEFVARMNPNVQNVVDFAKQVPGFCNLNQGDQLKLIKFGFFEIWFCHVARLTSDTSFIFDDGTLFNREQLEIVYNKKFVFSLLDFINTFNALELNDTEIGLFSAVALLNNRRPSMIDGRSIQNYQDEIMESLKVQVCQNHANDPQTFAKLMIKLRELNNLGLKHNRYLDLFRVKNINFALPPLVAEMIDISQFENNPR